MKHLVSTVRRPRAAVLRFIALAIMSGVGGCGSPPMQLVDSYAPTLNGELHGLRGQFFGTTTILLRDDDNAILFDGFFSRPSLESLVLTEIAPDSRRIDQALTRIDTQAVNYLFVSHSHLDHAMDAPAVAERTKATLVGWKSTCRIAQGWELSQGAGSADEATSDSKCTLKRLKFLPAVAGDSVSAGNFKVTLLATSHAPYQFEDEPRRQRDFFDPLRAWLERKLAGEINRPLWPPARFTDYRLGDSYAFLIEHPHGNVLIVPSAGVPRDLGGVKANVVFLSIGDADKLSNEHIKEYWREVVQKTHAELVIPVHWDNQSGPLEDGPLKAFPSFVDNTACAMETLAFLNGGRVAIRFMPVFITVPLDSRSLSTLKHRNSGQGSDTVDPFEKGCRRGRH